MNAFKFNVGICVANNPTLTVRSRRSREGKFLVDRGIKPFADTRKYRKAMKLNFMIQGDYFYSFCAQYGVME